MIIIIILVMLLIYVKISSMQVIKADDYQGWVYKTNDALIAVDPWLTDCQKFPKNGFLLKRQADHEHILNKGINKNSVTHIILTAHFSDHLDPDSFLLFDRNIPIFTTSRAKKILVKFGFSNITVVKRNVSYELGDAVIHVRPSGNPYHSTSFSYICEDESGSLFHEAHVFNPNILEELKDRKLNLLILTGDLVKVFGLVKVSMSICEAKSIQDKLKTKYLAITGNLPSKFSGVIARFLYYKERVGDEVVVCSKPWQTINF